MTYQKSSCCAADCFALGLSPNEPCWGEVEVIAEEWDEEDSWWVHACKGHINAYDGEREYHKETTD